MTCSGCSALHGVNPNLKKKHLADQTKATNEDTENIGRALYKF